MNENVVTDNIEMFVELHRQKLLRYLDGNAPSSPHEPGPLEYVDQVLDEWSRLCTGRTVVTSCPAERTFWYALYQLEELVENPVQGRFDSYECVLLENLAEVRELLRSRSALPEEFYATRPGEQFTDDA